MTIVDDNVYCLVNTCFCLMMMMLEGEEEEVEKDEIKREKHGLKAEVSKRCE